MKYETIFIMVRVAVHADHTQLSNIVHEIETQSKLALSDTANVNVLETEILLSRVRNTKNINYGTQLNDIHIETVENGFWSAHDTKSFALLTKANKERKRIIAAYKENISVFDVSCGFDINALPFQVFNECVRDFGAGDGNYGAADQTTSGFCQSMISRILVTLNNESFKSTFGFTEESKAQNEFTSKVEEFLMPDSAKDVLIISVANIPSENKLREILVNAIGRFLLEKALGGDFKSLVEADKKKSLLLFLDEAHLFLDFRLTEL